MDRTILHCDCNGFYASVECVLNHDLRDVPMAVCGNPEYRHGIILAKNELAKRRGVKTAETVWQARRKCPNLVLVPPHREEYLRYSRMVGAIYERFTDLVEPFGIDESWLDITGSMHLFGGAREVADRIRETVRTETGLTVSVGVSFNKIFAKLGSDYKKPDATTVITRENYRELLYPLPVSAMLFVGESVQQKLARLGVRTIGDLARCDRKLVAAALGKAGEMLHDYACGLDDSPVKSAYADREMKSVGNGMTFRRDLTGARDIRLGVSVLADTVAARLRKYGMKCATVQVTIKDDRLHTISRQKPADPPTYLAAELARISCELIAEAWPEGKPIRMITVTAENLVPEHEAVEQLRLFGEEEAAGRQRREQLETAVDALREKFGRDAVVRGGVLDNDLGIEK